MKKERILHMLIALTLLLIWGHSLVGKEASSAESNFVLQLLAPVLEHFVGQGNVTGYLVRKLAHFSEYTVLGAELSLLFADSRKTGRKALFFSVTCGLYTAFIDETIQIFSGRGPAVTDMWIDLFGTVAGALTVLLILLIKDKAKNR